MSQSENMKRYAAERIITKAIVECRELDIDDETIAAAVVKIAMEEGLAGHQGRRRLNDAA